MALENLTIAVGAAAVGLVTSIFVGYGSTTLVRDATQPPPPRYIIPIALEWDAKTGRIGQLLLVQGPGPVNGTWGASFWRGDKKLCGGGGRSEYPLRDGNPADIKWMTTDKWTGDQCPPILPGDIATATWEYQGKNGEIRSASIEYMIP